MTRVLLTGAGGFVGSHFLAALLDQTTWSVIAVDSFRHNGATDRVADVLATRDATRVEVVAHDLTTPFSPRFRAVVGPKTTESLHAIFDVASLSQVDASISNPASFIMNNVAVTVNTLDLARQVGCESYVHLSTDEVYGSRDVPASPHEHRPSSPYAASKAAQNDVCHAYHVTYGVPVQVFTSSNMFGERQSQLAYVPRVVRAALADEPVQVHHRGGVYGRRFYSYAADVAEWIVESTLERDPDDLDEPLRHFVLPGRYHADNGYLARVVWRLTVECAGRSTEPKLEYVEVDEVRPGYDLDYFQLDGYDDGWAHPVHLENAPFEDRLRRTVEWFVALPHWLEA